MEFKLDNNTILLILVASFLVWYFFSQSKENFRINLPRHFQQQQLQQLQQLQQRQQLQQLQQQILQQSQRTGQQVQRAAGSFRGF
jgi:hypothetical protein